MNVITNFKDREIDFNKPVDVYRCLQYKKEKVYSIRQKGKVVAHTTCLLMQDVVFKVSEKGKNRVRSENKKYVHAYIKGYISDKYNYFNPVKFSEYNITLPIKITYDPYINDTFVGKHEDIIYDYIMKSAKVLMINKLGVSAKYVNH